MAEAPAKQEATKKPNPSRWKKGQSGNPNGRPRKGETITEQLRAVLAERDEDGVVYARKVAEVWVTKAVAGDPVALKGIADRVDGMPRQTLTHEGSEERPVTIRCPERPSATKRDAK